MRGFSLKSFRIDWGFAEGKLPLESVLADGIILDLSTALRVAWKFFNEITENAWLFEICWMLIAIAGAMLED